MGLLHRLFGSGSAEPPGEAVEYNGYRIRATPRSQGGQYLTAGVISKDFPDGEKHQSFIRADTHASHEDACQHALRKAQQLIDEQGDKLFHDAERPI